MVDVEDVLERARRSSALADHADYLHRLIRPAVRIELGPVRPETSSSRLGGRPALPVGFEWPDSKVGWYRFLGQINFAEVPETHLLPSRGLLSLFFQEDEAGEAFWGAEGFVLGFYFRDTTELADTPAPGDVLHRSAELWGSRPSVSGLAFKAAVDLPTITEMLPDCPFDERAHDAYGLLVEEIGAGGDHLLGYPRGYTLAYDPTPGPEWLTLLTLRSHEGLNLCWHDGDHLSVFVEEPSLRASDFSRLSSDAG